MPRKLEHEWINNVHGKASKTVARGVVTDDDALIFSYWVQLLIIHYHRLHSKRSMYETLTTNSNPHEFKNGHKA